MGRGARHTRQKQRAVRESGQLSLAEKHQRAARHGPQGPYVPPPPRVYAERSYRAPSRPWRTGPWLRKLVEARTVGWALAVSSVGVGVAGALPPHHPLRPLLGASMGAAILLGIAALVAAAIAPSDLGAPGRLRAGAAGPGTLGVQLRLRDEPVYLGFGVMVLTVLPIAVLAAVVAEALGMRDVQGAGSLGVLGALGFAAAVKRARDAGSELVLGDEAVRVPVGWGRTRAVRYASVAGLDAGERALVLRLREGGSVAIDWRWLKSGERNRLARDLGKRCPRDEAPAEPESPPVPEVAGPRYALLDRAGRSVAEWREAVAGLLAPGRGYRQVALSREDVVRVLVDPATPAERKIGAAMALVGAGDGEGSTRVRAAVEAVDEKRVRVALERVLDGDLDETAVERAVRKE